MKKLLLILICLFVSFEVRSESDDLSGKKLLCEDDSFMKGENVFQGYEFYSNGQVTYYYYQRYLDAPITKESDFWSYTTSTDKIYLERTKLPDFIITHNKLIDRLTYEGHEYTDYDMEGREDPQHFSKCKIFEGDLYNHLKEIKQNFDNEVKSKQKI